MKKITCGILLVSIFLGSCKKYLKEGDLDKEVILEIPLTSSWGTTYPDFKNLPAFTYLVDFDKRDYPKVDSITFNATMLTDRPTDTAYVRLFNLTDNVAIANSTLSASTNTSFEDVKMVRTNNLYQSLPEKKITLVVQTKGIRSGAIYTAFLKLRRN
jgi:hypothetical protein